VQVPGLAGTEMTLLWRVFLANAALLMAGALTLALTPITISARIALAEALVLAVWLAVMLATNLLLLRPLLGPLTRLAHRMEDVDVLRGSVRVPAHSPGEVGALERAFNAMISRLEAERREAGSRALAAQEGERQRIAGELHDEIGQTMTGVLFQLKRLSRDATPEQRPALRQAQEAVRSGLEEVRRIAQELRPEVLDHLGLASALTNLARTFSERTGIAVSRQVASDLPALDPESELVLYRVAQESFTNVARHSGAKHASLALERGRQSVVLRICDDGRGLDGKVEGGGLRGIRERALIVGGALAVKRAASGGVEVRLEVPAQTS
jgi:two-component system sensor histidine kinase UhpB